MAKGSHRYDGWASGTCPPAQVTSAIALGLERQLDRSRDFLRAVDDIAAEKGAAYALGAAEQALRSLISAAEEML